MPRLGNATYAKGVDPSFVMRGRAAATARVGIHLEKHNQFNSPRAPRRVAWARLRSPRIPAPLAAVSPRRGRLGLRWALPRLALRRRSGTPRRDAADRADDVGTVLNEARLVGRRVRRRDRQI